MLKPSNPMKILNFFVILILINLQLVKGQQTSQVYDFPVKPGTQEWEILSNYSDRLNAYNIPEELLNKMNTNDLLETCLNYPEFRLIMTRNSLQQGYDYLRSIFNGFRMLEKKNDAGAELLKKYKELKPADINNYKTLVDRGEFAFKIKYIEILLSQKQIINDMDHEIRKELLRTSILNYETILKMPEDYSSFGLVTPALVLGRLLDAVGHQNFIEEKIKDNNLQMFINDASVGEVTTLSYILATSKAYLNQLDNE